MATVNFCERCNTMGKSIAMDSIQITAGAVWSAPMEICPGCRQDIQDFMDGKPVGAVKDSARPKSYTERWTQRKIDPLASLSDDEIARAYLARVAARESVNELTASPEDDEDGTL